LQDNDISLHISCATGVQAMPVMSQCQPLQSADVHSDIPVANIEKTIKQLLRSILKRNNYDETTTAAD